LERVTVLCSTLPLANTDEGGIKARLSAYCEGLEGCELVDLQVVVADLLAGRPTVLKWAPSAPELAQAVRDAKARRLWGPSKALADKTDEAPDDCQPTDEERERIQAKWAQERPTFEHKPSPEQWKKDRIADGTIRKAG